jgi:L-rhamnose-H+ transport protein
MRKYQFEHWWFVSGVAGLVVMPWTIALVGCHHPWDALRGLPWSAIALGNLFALGWGIANVLCGLCYYRIGVALTGAFLGGLGASTGAIVPMIFKGSGRFQSAPLDSPAGMAVLAGVAVLLAGVVFAAMAGFGRDRALKKLEQTSGGFLGGLIMAVTSGVLSSFMAFVFVYSHDPIIASFSDVDPKGEITVIHGARKQTCIVSADGMAEIAGVGPVHVGGASAAVAAQRIADCIRSLHPGDPPQVRVETGSITATFAVFAVGLVAGALLNIGFAVHRLNRNRSWHVLLQSGTDFMLAIIIGVNFSLAVTLGGKGMLLLGALGASIGWGIQQAMQMTGGQMLGFVSGEWRGVQGTPRRQMYLAIALLIAASFILTYGKTLARGL